MPKEKNKIADMLSKLSRVEKLSNVWSSDPPRLIITQLEEDANCVHS